MHLLCSAEPTQPSFYSQQSAFSLPPALWLCLALSLCLDSWAEAQHGFTFWKQEGNARRKEAKERRSQVLNVKEVLPKAAALVPVPSFARFTKCFVTSPTHCTPSALD